MNNEPQSNGSASMNLTKHAGRFLWRIAAPFVFTLVAVLVAPALLVWLAIDAIRQLWHDTKAPEPHPPG